LRDFKALIRGSRYYIKKHHKNVQTLTDLGITYKIREQILLELIAYDYSSGPNSDENGIADYWIFGKDIDNVEIYIKLQIVVFSDGDEQGVCISFHPSEYALRNPLKTA
jgi:hypothetical protein